MASSDISTDLSPGRLTPATSVRAVGGQPPPQNSDQKARRHAPDGDAEDEHPAEANDEPAHQLDRLA